MHVRITTAGKRESRVQLGFRTWHARARFKDEEERRASVLAVDALDNIPSKSRKAYNAYDASIAWQQSLSMTLCVFHDRQSCLIISTLIFQFPAISRICARDALLKTCWKILIFFSKQPTLV